MCVETSVAVSACVAAATLPNVLSSGRIYVPLGEAKVNEINATLLIT